MANDMWGSILDAVLKLVSKKIEDKASPQPTAPQQPLPPPQLNVIDWSNPECKISKRFKVKEATYLHSWGVYHVPSEDEKAAIVDVAHKVDSMLDEMETLTGEQLHANVHAWIRPGVANVPGSQWDGKDYNRWIYENEVWKNLTAEQKAQKHVPDSPHKKGHAIDFNIIRYEGADKCASIRQIINSHDLLEKYGLRMEDINGGWIHNDNLPVVHNRFFKP